MVYVIQETEHSHGKDTVGFVGPANEKSLGSAAIFLCPWEAQECSDSLIQAHNQYWCGLGQGPVGNRPSFTYEVISMEEALKRRKR